MPENYKSFRPDVKRNFSAWRRRAEGVGLILTQRRKGAEWWFFLRPMEVTPGVDEFYSNTSFTLIEKKIEAAETKARLQTAAIVNL